MKHLFKFGEYLFDFERMTGQYSNIYTNESIFLKIRFKREDFQWSDLNHHHWIVFPDNFNTNLKSAYKKWLISKTLKEKLNEEGL